MNCLRGLYLPEEFISGERSLILAVMELSG